MDDKLLNILSNGNKDINNQKLIDYLSGNLPAEERHDIEKQIADSDFLNDAVDGLEEVKNKKDLSLFVDQLNAELQKNLDKKKKRKLKHTLKEYPWLYLAIVIILLLAIVCFIVIKKHLDSKTESNKILPATEQTHP